MSWKVYGVVGSVEARLGVGVTGATRVWQAEQQGRRREERGERARSCRPQAGLGVTMSSCGKGSAENSRGEAKAQVWMLLAVLRLRFRPGL